ncbi:response regulator [Adhaeribacter aerolatus]|uniref:Response regulator n=1 Tax=Adhaeribacter aerolatus TaxID=670289 RepID=A0A512AUK4_9BACT|nr:response regulator [Adhaeribacter aerolatus]GEO03385.1 response regulator [Adhaeribacter aerolatus]
MKIFIIDDDEVSIFFARHLLLLENAAPDITTFLCAEEALQTLQASAVPDLPDAIFLDLNMPIMDGWEFLEALAPIAQKITQNCRIFILTSSLDYSDILKIKDYPLVSGFIHKPIKQEDIQMVISPQM